MFLLLFVSSYVFVDAIVVPIGFVLPEGRDDLRVRVESFVRAHNQNPRVKFQIVARIGSVDGHRLDGLSVDRIICREFDRRIYALIGAVETSASDPLVSYANILRIPYLIASVSDRSTNADFSIRIGTSYGKILFDVVSCVIRREKTDLKNPFNYDNAIVYFYQSEFGLTRLRRLLDATKSPVKIRLAKRFDSRTNVVRLLADFRDAKTKYFVIVDCSLECARKIVDLHSKSKNLSKQNFHYFIIPNDETWTFDENRQNLAITTFDGRFGRAHLVVDAIDLLISAFNRLLDKNHELDVRNEEMRCDNTTNRWKNGERMMRILRKQTLTGSTGYVSFDKFGNRQNLTMNVIESNFETPQKITEWTDTNGLDSSCTSWPERKNKTKSIYVVTSILDEPYLMLRNGTFEGYCKDLADQIAKLLQIDYAFKLVDDSRYGGPDRNSPNGWDGMVGELIADKADLAIAPLTITSARERVVSFTKPFMTLGISIMMAKPLVRQKDIFSFMKPLSMEIWMCIVFAFVGVTAVLIFVIRISHESARSEGVFTVCDTIWFSFATLVQQGGDTLPRSLAAPIVVGFWWFFSLIIITSYTANLAAFLTAQRLVAPINSAHDLARQTRVEYGIIQQGSTQEFFENPIYQQMWESMTVKKDRVMVNNNDQGTNRVRNSGGTFAFLVESVKNDYTNRKRPCDTIKVGPHLDTKGYGIATAYDSPLRQNLTIAVLTLIENGKLERLYAKWWQDTGECLFDDSESHENELSVSNVAGIFYVLSGGLVLAIITALCTALCKRFL